MHKEKIEKILVFTDGGSRGNPGPAGIGVYIKTFEKKYGQYIGETTNNDAEYQAIIFALKKCKALIGSEKSKDAEIEIRSDSQLIVSQLNGDFKIKEESLFNNFIEIWNLKQDFKKVIFTHIRRELNKVADLMVNEALDEKESHKTMF